MGAIQNRLPCRVLYGRGAAEELANLLPEGNLVLMSEEGLAKTELFQRVRTSLPRAEVYLQKRGEPKVSDLQRALDALKGKKPKGIVGIGGGSVLDVAKAAALLIDKDMPAAEAIGRPDLRRNVMLALIPTTAGTGSEATPNCLLIDDRDGVKRAIIADGCIPDIAVLDPDMTRSLPAEVAAYTGIDALCHCVESSISIKANEVSRAWSLAGIRLILAYLPKIIRSMQEKDERDEDVEEAREKLLFASFFGGAALAVAGTTAVHALAYSLGKRGVPHGVSNSLLFEAVMEQTLGEPERYIERYDECVSLIHSLPIPAIDRYHVYKDECGAMAKEAMEQVRLLDNHPVQVTQACAERIFQSLFEGEERADEQNFVL